MEELVMVGPVVYENAFDGGGHHPARPRPKRKVDGRFVDHLLQTLRGRPLRPLGLRAGKIS